MKWLIVLTAYLSIPVKSQYPMSPCRLPAAQESCEACAKMAPHCAWCLTDGKPHTRYSPQYRCDSDINHWDCLNIDKRRSSDHCYGKGSYMCGRCMCPAGRYGEKCECSEDLISNAENNNLCMGKDDQIPCSGRGECVCGFCKCFSISPSQPQAVYSGVFCECDDTACPRNHQGELCSGPDRGICQCGRCKCQAGFVGDNCNCSSETYTCYDKHERLCGQRGSCECGRCVCQQGFSGAVCEHDESTTSIGISGPCSPGDINCEGFHYVNGTMEEMPQDRSSGNKATPCHRAGLQVAVCTTLLIKALVHIH